MMMSKGGINTIQHLWGKEYVLIHYYFD